MSEREYIREKVALYGVLAEIPAAMRAALASNDISALEVIADKLGKVSCSPAALRAYDALPETEAYLNGERESCSVGLDVALQRLVAAAGGALLDPDEPDSLPALLVRLEDLNSWVGELKEENRRFASSLRPAE